MTIGSLWQGSGQLRKAKHRNLQRPGAWTRDFGVDGQLNPCSSLFRHSRRQAASRGPRVSGRVKVVLISEVAWNSGSELTQSQAAKASEQCPCKPPTGQHLRFFSTGYLKKMCFRFTFHRCFWLFACSVHRPRDTVLPSSRLRHPACKRSCEWSLSSLAVFFNLT